MIDRSLNCRTGNNKYLYTLDRHLKVPLDNVQNLKVNYQKLVHVAVSLCCVGYLLLSCRA